MSELIVLIIFALLATYFWGAVKAKELAIRAGRAACEKRGLQFLDQTVEQRLVRFGLDERKNPSWKRTYYFEFATSGEFRYEGQIVMHGHRLQSIQLDPYPDPIIQPEQYLEH